MSVRKISRHVRRTCPVKNRSGIAVMLNQTDECPELILLVHFKKMFSSGGQGFVQCWNIVKDITPHVRPTRTVKRGSKPPLFSLTAEKKRFGRCLLKRKRFEAGPVSLVR